MTDVTILCARIMEHHAAYIDHAQVKLGELTLDVKPEFLIKLAYVLHDEPTLDFKFLVDVCGIDYLDYGLDEWQTRSATESGFSRGVTANPLRDNPSKPYRFAVIYHLLSLSNNHRIRLRVFLSDEEELIVDSVTQIWPAANWFERETFDLFGILFRGHADLRRLLTDYGFNGHPFRKDFPLIGKVEARYDAKSKRVVYQPVTIVPRVLEPKVIRHDNRYLGDRYAAPQPNADVRGNTDGK